MYRYPARLQSWRQSIDIDPDRWQRLLAAYRNAVDTSPPFIRLQEAHATAARARADLDRYQTQGPEGQRDARNPHIEKTFKRGVAELEQRIAAAAREVRRIEDLQREAATRRSGLQQQIDGIRQWARQQSPPVVLPGDDEVQMTGFASAAVRVPQPAASPFAGARLP